MEEHWKVLVQTCDGVEPPTVSAGILVAVHRRTTCSGSVTSAVIPQRAAEAGEVNPELSTPLSLTSEVLRSGVSQHSLPLSVVFCQHSFLSVHSELGELDTFTFSKIKKVTKHVLRC